MKKVWSKGKEILKCLVAVLVVLAIGASILLPPIFAGVNVGKEFEAQKFAEKQGERYEEIAKVFIKDIDEIGEKYDFSHVRIELLKENQEEGMILFELSQTGAKYSYTDPNKEEWCSIGFSMVFLVIWIVVVIIIANFVCKFIEKLRKKN